MKYSGNGPTMLAYLVQGPVVSEVREWLEGQNEPDCLLDMSRVDGMHLFIPSSESLLVLFRLGWPELRTSIKITQAFLANHLVG